MRSIADVPGITVGHFTAPSEMTGCTVIVCADGAIANMHSSGTVAGTHELDLLRSGTLVQRINALLLTGGGTFGLRAVKGVMRYLEERRRGFEARGHIVPIVPAASIFDLATARTRPGEDWGYWACEAAGAADIAEGGAGAGTGARIGKAPATERAMAGGVGTASSRHDDHAVGALVVVDCNGCVMDPVSHVAIAGPREPATGQLRCDSRQIATGLGSASVWPSVSVGVIATDAPLNKAQAGQLAQAAGLGFARVLSPGVPELDAWIVFAVSTAPEDARTVSSAQLIGLQSYAAELLAGAVVRAATAGVARG